MPRHPGAGRPGDIEDPLMIGISADGRALRCRSILAVRLANAEDSLIGPSYSSRSP